MKFRRLGKDEMVRPYDILSIFKDPLMVNILEAFNNHNNHSASAVNSFTDTLVCQPMGYGSQTRTIGSLMDEAYALSGWRVTNDAGEDMPVAIALGLHVTEPDGAGKSYIRRMIPNSRYSAELPLP